MTYVIAQPCVDLKDRACVDECPVDCIYEGKRMLYIHPDECVDCGACEPVCPVEAIFYEDDTPEQWKDYYNANVDFFDDLGSPGGAAKLGVIDKDHPLIAALPFPQNAGMTTAATTTRRPPSLVGGAFGFHAPCPTSPGTTSRRTATAPGRTRTGSSTSRSAPRSTRRPRSCSRPSPTPPTRPGYPLTVGRADTRQAAVDWLARRFGVTGLGVDAVLPVIGSKELIASLPAAPRPRRRRPGRAPGAGLPDLRGGRPAGRCPHASPPTR